MALVAVTALRLAAALSVPLTGDEAYYWTWTQHLALGYHDHPPMVAWLIALATHLLGTTTGAVRLPFVLLGAAVAWLTFMFGWSLTRSARAACWAGGLTLLTPIFTVSAMVAFPDSCLLLACAAFFLFAWRAVQHDGTMDWVTAGLSAGLAGLSKLTGLYLIPALFAFIITSPAQRHFLRRRGIWIMLACCAATLSPFIYWNCTHGFESVVYQFGSRLGNPQSHHKVYLPTFLLFSAVALSPILFVAVVWSVWRAAQKSWRSRDEAAHFVVIMAAPLPIIFLLCSLIAKVGIHWTAPGCLAAFSAFGAWMRRPPSRARRLWTVAGAACALLIIGLLYLFALAPATLMHIVSGTVQFTGINHGRPLKTTEITETLGYPDAGLYVHDLVRGERAQGRNPFLITTNYTLSSALWFYSGEPFHVIMGTAIGAQYDHWDDFPRLLGRDAIYVDTSPIETREDVWQNLHAAFSNLTLLPPYVTHGRGVEARTIYVARCSDFRNDIFTALQSTHRH